MSSFKFPPTSSGNFGKGNHWSAPPTPAAFDVERRASVSAPPPQHFTVSGFVSEVTSPLCHRGPAFHERRSRFNACALVFPPPARLQQKLSHRYVVYPDTSRSPLPAFEHRRLIPPPIQMV